MPIRKGQARLVLNGQVVDFKFNLDDQDKPSITGIWVRGIELISLCHALEQSDDAITEALDRAVAHMNEEEALGI